MTISYIGCQLIDGSPESTGVPVGAFSFILRSLTVLVWAEPKILRPGASRSPIVHLRISRSTQVAGETTP